MGVVGWVERTTPEIQDSTIVEGKAHETASHMTFDRALRAISKPLIMLA